MNGTSGKYEEINTLPGTAYLIPESAVWEILGLLDDVVSPKVEYNVNQLTMAESALSKSRNSGALIAGILYTTLKDTKFRETIEIVCDKYAKSNG